MQAASDACQEAIWGLTKIRDTILVMVVVVVAAAVREREREREIDR